MRAPALLSWEYNEEILFQNKPRFICFLIHQKEMTIYHYGLWLNFFWWLFRLWMAISFFARLQKRQSMQIHKLLNCLFPKNICFCEREKIFVYDCFVTHGHVVRKVMFFHAIWNEVWSKLGKIAEYCETSILGFGIIREIYARRELSLVSKESPSSVEYSIEKFFWFSFSTRS